ncbi:MAG: hypothetical protein ACHQRO_09620, partial [Vicinamibacteria bacterium]
MRILLVMLLALVQANTPVPGAPSATIANGQLRASIHLPDAKAGYYRGARFDWAGQVSSLTFKGHEYFGQWFEQYDPTLHDAIQGPVEEFLTGDTALGYAEAAPGATFVRIGIGVLRKPTEASFQRFGRYDIVDNGKWTTKAGKDRIEFVHELKDGTGYAYTYRKTLRLSGESLIIEHELKNTGTKPIVTTVYNHNFFTLDGKTTGPDNVVRFPFAPKAARPLNGMAEVRGREIAIARPFEAKENVFTELEGFGTAASDNGFEMENRATGAGVRVAGDRPLSKLYFWSAYRT